MTDERRDATIETGNVYDLASDPGSDTSALSPSDSTSSVDSTAFPITDSRSGSETPRLLPEWIGPTISGFDHSARKADELQAGIRAPLNTASRVVTPLGWGDNAYKVGQHLVQGDLREAGAEAFSVSGSVAGAWAGAKVGFDATAWSPIPIVRVMGVAAGAGAGGWLGGQTGKNVLPPPSPNSLPITDDLAPTIDTGNDVFVLIRTSSKGGEDTFAWYHDTQRSAFYEQHPTISEGRYLKVSNAEAAELTDQYLHAALPAEDYAQYREQILAIAEGASEAVARVIGGGTPTGEPLFEWIELEGGSQRIWTRDESGKLIGLTQHGEHVLESRFGDDGRIEHIAQHNTTTGESQTLVGPEPTPNPHAWADEPRPALGSQASTVPPLLEDGRLNPAFIDTFNTPLAAAEFFQSLDGIELAESDALESLHLAYQLHLQDLALEAAAGMTGRSVAEILDLDVPGNPNAPGYHASHLPGGSGEVDPSNPLDADTALLEAEQLVARGDEGGGPRSDARVGRRHDLTVADGCLH